MSEYSVAGKPLRWARIDHPSYRAWTAELELADAEGVSGLVELRLPGLSLMGSVPQGGVSYERQMIRLMGGRGGLTKQAEGQHFQRADVETILRWLLAQGGELLSPSSDPAVLARQLDHWQHRRCSVGCALDELTSAVGTSWWTASDGTIQVGAPTWAPSQADYDLAEENLLMRRWVVVSTTAAVLPGTTFRERQVHSVTHALEGDRWRSIVRWT